MIMTTPIYNVTYVLDFVFIDIPFFTSEFSLIFKDENHIGGVMVSMLSSSAVDRGFEPR